MKLSHVFLTGLFTVFLASALTAGNGSDVVELKLRDHNVRIKTTEKGPLYTVFEHGKKKPVVKEVTEGELQARNPELYETIKPAIAKDGVIDASLNHREPATKDLVAPTVPR